MWRDPLIGTSYWPEPAPDLPEPDEGGDGYDEEQLIARQDELKEMLDKLEESTDE